MLKAKTNLMILVAMMTIAYVLATSSDVVAEENDLCGKYKNFYIESNKEASLNKHSGFFDDSAPRETNRQLRILNERVSQLVIFQQMQAHNCDLSIEPPGDFYESGAIGCAVEAAVGDGKTCDKEKWISSWPR